MASQTGASYSEQSKISLTMVVGLFLLKEISNVCVYICEGGTLA